VEIYGGNPELRDLRGFVLVHRLKKLVELVDVLIHRIFGVLSQDLKPCVDSNVFDCSTREPFSVFSTMSNYGSSNNGAIAELAFARI
jgi:hypothetical protein